MSIINKQLAGLVFGGAPLALAAAPWKNNVRVIYGFNAGGNGYTSFKPGSQFNSLTQLVADGVYIVDSVTLGYDLPGGALAATGSAAALTVSKTLLGFMFSDAALTLAAAGWKNNVRVMYGFNAGGNGYTSFKPSSQFNSLTQLLKDAVYILDSATTGYQIPGGASVSGPAPTYYVSATGNDNASGLSAGTAWASLARVNAAVLQPGDVVAFEGGREFVGQLVPVGGTAGQRVTYTSYGSGAAVLVGDNQSAVLIDKSNVTLRGLKMLGRNQVANTTPGVYLQAAGSWVENVTLDRCEITQFGDSGFYSYPSQALYGFRNIELSFCESHGNSNGFASDGSYETSLVPRHNTFNIHHCTAHHNAGTGITTQQSGSGFVLGGMGNSVVEYCLSYENGGQNANPTGGPMGFYCYESLGLTMRYNVAHHNQSGPGAGRFDGGGFDIDGGCERCVLEYNYTHDNWGPGFAFLEYGASNPEFAENVIRYNVSVNDARAMHGSLTVWTSRPTARPNWVHNNLFVCGSADLVASPTHCIYQVPGSDFTNLRISNNIFVVDGPSAVMFSTVTPYGAWGNNLYHSVSGVKLNYSVGGIVADPLLTGPLAVAPAAGAFFTNGFQGLAAFRLQAGSPAINAGAVPAGLALPAKDFFGGPVPVGVVNIGPHEA